MLCNAASFRNCFPMIFLCLPVSLFCLSRDAFSWFSSCGVPSRVLDISWVFHAFLLIDVEPEGATLPDALPGGRIFFLSSVPPPHKKLSCRWEVYVAFFYKRGPVMVCFMGYQYPMVVFVGLKSLHSPPRNTFFFIKMSCACTLKCQHNLIMSPMRHSSIYITW